MTHSFLSSENLGCNSNIILTLGSYLLYWSKPKPVKLYLLATNVRSY